MSILAPSRSDLSGVHTNSVHGPLGPSAMPPFPPTSGALFQSVPLDKSRIEQVGQQNALESVSLWRKGVEHSPKQITLPPRDRDALTDLDTNTTSLAPPAISRVGSTLKPSARASTSTSIPRPAAVPDVFASTEPDRSLTAKSSLLSANAAQKRVRDAVTASASTAKKAKMEKDQQSQEEVWRAKWVKIFPTLIFHFEIGTEGQGRVLESRVKAMGAKVDQFFSSRVTHLIAKSLGSPKKAMAPPPRKNAMRESPKNPFLDGTGVTDLITKAETLGMKVWTVDKLTNMLNLLAPVEVATNDSLHTLLEEERIHGTRERDVTAPRPDYYYFKPGSKYLLIEDATGRHRPIMMKECAMTKDGPEWPTLYEKFLRPSSSNQSTIDPAKIRARAWSLYVERKPFEGEQPPNADLKRSTSLRALPSTPKLPEAIPYQNASGNSVVLTSNIASTSAANPSPAAYSQNGMGMYKDRALMQMNKRVQVLKGNARLAAAKRDSVTEASIAELNSRRASTGSTQAAPSIPPKTFLSYLQLVGMLEQARRPVRESNVSVEARKKNRAKVEAGLKGREQETAAGYCENCRLRYNDLSVHVQSRKHRRFATNPENFSSLDRLLAMLARPPNPKLCVPEHPPCEVPHSKDDHCDLCVLYDTEEDEGELEFFRSEGSEDVGQETDELEEEGQSPEGSQSTS